MAGNVVPIINEHARQEWLKQYPAKFLVCRQGHSFPKPIPRSGKFTRTRIEYDAETGERTIHQSCSHCGRVRWRPIVQFRGGWALAGKCWKYKDPIGYAQPPGYGIARADFASAYWTAIVEDYDDSVAAIESALNEQNGNKS